MDSTILSCIYMACECFLRRSCCVIQEGFKYHHAEEGYVMLTYWISEGPSLLPGNASHHVGVGGFVINSRNEVRSPENVDQAEALFTISLNIPVIIYFCPSLHHKCLKKKKTKFHR